MNLSNLTKQIGKERSKKRLGRGIGSGKGGHTVGRGSKGQKARKGNGKPWAGFEGGQVPLFKRLPRFRTFRSSNKEKPIAVSLNIFNHFEDKSTVTPIEIIKKKLIKGFPSGGIKVLANGEMKKKLTLKGFTYSNAALQMIEKSGSKIESNSSFSAPKVAKK